MRISSWPEFLFWCALGLAFSLFCLWSGLEDALSQEAASPAQEQVERTIGSLVVRNAQCNAQVLTLNSEVQKLRDENAKLKEGQKK